MPRFSILFGAFLLLWIGRAFSPDPAALQNEAEQLMVSANPEDQKRAVDLLRLALPGHPGSPYLWSDLAAMLIETGDVDGARQASKRSVELAPWTPQILLRDIDVALETGDAARAKVDLAAMVGALSAPYNVIPDIYRRFFPQCLATGAAASCGLEKTPRPPRP